LPFLTSERLYFRGLTTEDATGPYREWMNDPEITQFLESRFFPQSEKSIAEFISNVNDGRHLFLAACLSSDGTHIGNIKLGPIEAFHRRADIGIIIGDKTQWGKGFAAEMISAVTDYGFNGLNLRKITAGCYANNPGSARAFLKAGFVEEARLKGHFFSHGEYVDYIMLAKFREDTKTPVV